MNGTTNYAESSSNPFKFDVRTHNPSPEPKGGGGVQTNNEARAVLDS